MTYCLLLSHELIIFFPNTLIIVKISVKLVVHLKFFNTGHSEQEDIMGRI